jgi:hypothetical protein
VVIAGYANEFLHYFTTPEEYDQQHYEGGSTLYGKYSSNLLRDALADLARRLTAGEPAPEPAAFDPTNGVEPDETPYGAGADTATVVSQPADTRRLTRATFAWQGGPRGLDRPLDRPFVRVERLARPGVWREVADDLGLQILWRVDDDGTYTVQWQVPLRARPGLYRFVVTANHYGVRSRGFRVRVARSLHARIVRIEHGRALVALDYPRLDDAADLVSHPHSARGGRVVAVVAGRRVRARSRRGPIAVPLRGASSLEVIAGADRFGNRVAPSRP